MTSKNTENIRDLSELLKDEEEQNIILRDEINQLKVMIKLIDHEARKLLKTVQELKNNNDHDR
jgi:uncharacterized phage infection (PIP) family protein YhgE